MILRFICFVIGHDFEKVYINQAIGGIFCRRCYIKTTLEYPGIPDNVADGVIHKLKRFR